MIAGALSAARTDASAYSASMNSYFWLTDAPSRSTRLLFSGTRVPFPFHGSAARVHANGPALTAPAAARLLRASSGNPGPSSPATSRLSRVPVLHPRSGARFPPPSGLPLPGTQVRTSGISLPRYPVLSGEDPTFRPGLRPEGMAPSGQSG